MNSWLIAIAIGILFSLIGAFWRAWHGPEQADHMIAAQLIGTGSVSVVLLLAAADGWKALDVALVLSLLSAFAAIAFIKASTRDGGGDPEEDAPENRT